MKIAVAANGNMLQSTIAEAFETCTFLLIVETDDMSHRAYGNAKSDQGLSMVDIIVKQDCEALISGTIEEPAFEALVEAHVTRYEGAKLSVLEALSLMDLNKLDYIREYNGKEWTPHDHSAETAENCDCGFSEDE